MRPGITDFLRKRNAKRMDLQPGDHLLYSPSTPCDWIVALKTCSNAVHIEIYAGDGKSMAIRPGRGVNLYDLRLNNLAYILRPKSLTAFDLARYWFNQSASGKRYDWKGLLCFTLAVAQGSPNKMFCSEFATNFDRHCCLQSFAFHFPADKIAPANFLMSPAFERVKIT